MLTWTALKRYEISPALPHLPPLHLHRALRGALVFCSLLLTTCAAQGYIDTVLFLVTFDQEHGQVSFEPVVEIAKGQFNSPQANPAFAQTYLNNRLYPLYQQGQLVGRVQSNGLASFGCSEVQNRAELQTTIPLIATSSHPQKTIYFLASSALLMDGPVALKPLSDADRNQLQDFGRGQLKALGLSEAELQKALLTDAARVDLGGGTVGLVGTVSLLADSVNTPGATVFMILEKEPQGWQPSLVVRKRFKSVYGEDFEGMQFRDALDLDRDGTPELILEVLRNENYQFQVLKRSGKSWQAIYTGGGGGC
ncbi:MAG: hypothetical protein H7Y37_13540 [Anaerolineae bacterium]|nr:hypothetical protein [Gloeobacterales cyanobacterium ES-bin-313]